MQDIRCFLFGHIIRFHLYGVLPVFTFHHAAGTELRMIYICRIADRDRLVMNHVLYGTHKATVRSAVIYLTCIRIGFGYKVNLFTRRRTDND